MMSYYLGLVGLGLFFVLLVHLYNRWTYFVFRREEALANQSLPPTAQSAIDDAANTHEPPPKLPPKTIIKPLPTHQTSTRPAMDATVVGQLHGVAAQTQLKSLFVGNKAATLGTSALAKASTASSTLHEADASLQTHQSFFVLGLEKLSAEECCTWMRDMQHASPFVVAIELLGQDNRWHRGWSSWATDNAPAQAMLSAQALQLFMPITQVEVVVQLANRRGHLSLEDWQNLEQKAVGQNTTLPSAKMAEVKVHVTSVERWLQRAQQLDGLCAEFDVQIALTLMCRESAGVSGGQVSRAAAQEGMVFSKGLFYKLDPEGNSLFSLEFAPTGSPRDSLENLENQIGGQVTLCLDIPRVAEGHKIFRDMAAFAQHLASAIRADLVDDRGHQLSSISLDTIGEQVQQIQLRMNEAGLPAGSLVAKQLFV